MIHKFEIRPYHSVSSHNRDPLFHRNLRLLRPLGHMKIQKIINLQNIFHKIHRRTARRPLKEILLKGKLLKPSIDCTLSLIFFTEICVCMLSLFYGCISLEKLPIRILILIISIKRHQYFQQYKYTLHHDASCIILDTPPGKSESTEP